MTLAHFKNKFSKDSINGEDEKEGQINFSQISPSLPVLAPGQPSRIFVTAPAETKIQYTGTVTATRVTFKKLKPHVILRVAHQRVKQGPTPYLKSTTV